MKYAAVAGTFDTKAAELNYIADLLKDAGVNVRTLDLSTSDYSGAEADVTADEIAEFHPERKGAVLRQQDLGSTFVAMAIAFEAYTHQIEWIGGMIGAGGSGGTALVAPAMRSLTVGTPKVLVSTVARGNVAPYVGPSDISMVYSVSDIQGLNRTTSIRSNPPNALAEFGEIAATY